MFQHTEFASVITEMKTLEERTEGQPNTVCQPNTGSQHNTDNFEEDDSTDSEDSFIDSEPSQGYTTEPDEYDSTDTTDTWDSSNSSIWSEIFVSDSETSSLEPDHLTTQTVRSDIPLASSEIIPNFEQPSTSYSITPNLTKCENITLIRKKSNLGPKLTDPDDATVQLRTQKKNGINFKDVTVYYFPRKQGFTCVPTQGGSTLGMGYQHSYVRNFSLSEHAAEQSRLHSHILKQLHSERRMNRTNESSTDNSESDEELNNPSVLELDPDNYYFVRPIPARKRRAILRAAGIRKIDSSEKDECRYIRSCREFCGCYCGIYCNPDTCPCSQAGIECQGHFFPCLCTRNNCANPSGRIESDIDRVRAHFIQTIMRLELEKKVKVKEDSTKIDAEETINENLYCAVNISLACESNVSQPKGMVQIDSSREKPIGTLLPDVNLNPPLEEVPYMYARFMTDLEYEAQDEGPDHQPPPSFTFRKDRYPEGPDSEFCNRQHQAVADPRIMAPHQPFLQPTSHFLNPRLPSDIGLETGSMQHIPTIQNENPPSYKISSDFVGFAQPEHRMFGPYMYDTPEFHANPTGRKPFKVQPYQNNMFTLPNDKCKASYGDNSSFFQSSNDTDDNWG